MMSGSSLTVEDSASRTLADGLFIHAQDFVMEDTTTVTVKGTFSVFGSMIDIQDRATITGIVGYLQDVIVCR